MAVKAKGGLNKNTGYMPGKPKLTLQGRGKGTKYAATSRNKARKPYRGQGKWLVGFIKKVILDQINVAKGLRPKQKQIKVKEKSLNNLK